MKRKIKWLPGGVIKSLKGKKGIIIIVDYTSVDMTKVVEYQATFGNVSRKELQEALIKTLKFSIDINNKPAEGYVILDGHFAIFASIEGFDENQNQDIAFKACHMC